MSSLHTPARAGRRAPDFSRRRALDDFFTQGAALISSSLAWIEVSRALLSRLDEADIGEDLIHEAIEVALSGIAERPMTGDVTSLARRVAPPVLRTPDAIHLATAILLDADVVLTYDERLAEACRRNGLAVSSPQDMTTRPGGPRPRG